MGAGTCGECTGNVTTPGNREATQGVANGEMHGTAYTETHGKRGLTRKTLQVFKSMSYFFQTGIFKNLRRSTNKIIRKVVYLTKYDGSVSLQINLIPRIIVLIKAKMQRSEVKLNF